MKKKYTIPNVTISIVLLLVGLTMIIPFVWMISTSLKEAKDVFRFPPQWIPNPVDWDNYIEIWQVIELGRGLLNSAIVTVSVVGIGTGIASMAAFSFAKLTFPHKNKLFMMLLSSMMIPGVVLLIPQFFIYARIGWIDTLKPLIVSGLLGTTMMTFFLRQYMAGLPTELIDAAKIDGCNYFGIYARIFLPLSKTAIAANVILLFMATWNDYLAPLVFVHSPKKATVQVVIASLSSYYSEQTDFPVVMAASVVAILPVLILFLTCQKYFVESFATSGIKG